MRQSHCTLAHHFPCQRYSHGKLPVRAQSRWYKYLQLPYLLICVQLFVTAVSLIQFTTMDVSKEALDSDHAEWHLSPAESDPAWEDARVKAIKRKVDIRLSITLAIMYIVNQIDRTNLPNA
jgi:hypothetical protein